MSGAGLEPADVAAAVDERMIRAGRPLLTEAERADVLALAVRGVGPWGAWSRIVAARRARLRVAR